MLGTSDRKPAEGGNTLGCGGVLTVLLVGVAAILGPILGPEGASERDEALRAFWPSLLPGGLIGISGAVASRLRSAKSGSPTWARNWAWSLAVLGYSMAVLAPPLITGVFYGVGSGALIAYALTWVVSFPLRHRRE